MRRPPVLTRAARPTARRRDLAGDAAEAVGEQFERAEMHALARGIAHLQHADDLVGEGLDHRDLEPEPEILHLGAQRLAFVEQRLGPHRKRMQALQQLRRRFCLVQVPRRMRRRQPAHRAAGRRD